MTNLEDARAELRRLERMVVGQRELVRRLETPQQPVESFAPLDPCGGPLPPEVAAIR